MSEWLDLMLQEIARKRREEREALQELQRRSDEGDSVERQRASRNAQSK